MGGGGLDGDEGGSMGGGGLGGDVGSGGSGGVDGSSGGVDGGGGGVDGGDCELWHVHTPPGQYGVTALQLLWQ